MEKAAECFSELEEIELFMLYMKNMVRWLCLSTGDKIGKCCPVLQVF